jgi:uncharacterized protein (TIGR02453 family)
MKFGGWRAEALEFYEGLEADNSKAYWQEHKSEYERLVLAPMEALLAELAAEFGEGRIFRPYRDTRFSADKSPYKTAIAASLACGGYIQLSAEGLFTGSGYWMMAPDQLDRYRRAVAGERSGEALARAIAEVAGAGIEVGAHDQLKTAPRGYPKDHPRIDLLRFKGLITSRRWPAAAWLGTAKAKDRVVGFLRASAPIRSWLDEHVGESTQPPPAR